MTRSRTTRVAALAIAMVGALTMAPRVRTAADVNLSALCLTCIQFTVERPIYVDGPTCCRVDSPFLLTKMGGQFVGYTANAFAYRMTGSSPDSLVLNPTPVVGPPSGSDNPADPAFDGCGRWLQVIDYSTTPYRGWYHAETGCNYPTTKMSIAYAESADGITWTFPTNGQPNNQIITYNPNPVPYDAFVNGHGGPSMIQWRPPSATEDYYYMYFLNATHTPEDDPNGPLEWLSSVARATVASGGKPGTWMKYLNGSWTSPGLLGRATKLTGMLTPTAFSFNTTYGQVMGAIEDLFAAHQGIYVAFSPDGLAFTRVAEPLVPVESNWNRPAPNELLGYSSINAFTGGRSWSDGFYLYNMYLEPGKDFFSRYQTRRTVSMTVGASAASPQVKLALSRYRSPSSGDSWTTTAYPAGDYQLEGDLGYIMTAPLAGTVPIADCVASSGAVDHIVPGSGVQGCPTGMTYLRTLGWVYDPALAPPAGTAPIFRCIKPSSPSTHFVSRDPTCSDEPGSVMELKLGYIMPLQTETFATLTVAAQGSGTVTTDDAAIHCPAGACSHLYTSGSAVTLHATPLAGFVFGGWSSSACSTGFVVMTADTGCGATFLPAVAGGPTPGSLSLNGSGFGDVFTYNPMTGVHRTQFSDGQGHFGETSAQWPAGLSVYAADFNADGLTDFFLYNAASGQWSKAISNGTGDFTYVNGLWGAGLQVFLVDLNGDHRSDAFVSNPATGVWSRCVTTGTGTAGFACTNGQWPIGINIYPTDLNADGLTDFFVYSPTTGQWSQALNDGVNGFTYLNGAWPAGLTIVPGDFNGDGRSDFFVSNANTGTWSVATTLPSRQFAYSSGKWSTGWTFATGDLNGDGKTDLFLYNPAAGWWYEAVSNGTGDFGLIFGTWSANWQVQMTDLNHDGHSDALVYNPYSGQWYQALNAGSGQFTYATGVWEPGLTVVASKPRIP